MKRFKFRFAAILKLRKSREEDALRALGAAQTAYQAEVQKKSELISAQNAALLRREMLGSEPTKILAFQIEADFISGNKQRIVSADRDIHRASRRVEKALRAYLFARRQTKMMELIYDKENVEFRRQQAKREQRFLDDLVVMRERLKEKEAS